MIGIVMRPVDAPTVKHEKLYRATVGTIELCLVRAKNAQHAERKLMECFKHELTDKTIDYNLEAWLKEQGRKE